MQEILSTSVDGFIGFYIAGILLAMAIRFAEHTVNLPSSVRL